MRTQPTCKRSGRHPWLKTDQAHPVCTPHYTAPLPFSDAAYYNTYVNDNHDEAPGPTPATPAAAASPRPTLDEAAMLWAPCVTLMSPTIDRTRLGPTPDLDGAFLEALF